MFCACYNTNMKQKSNNENAINTPQVQSIVIAILFILVLLVVLWGLIAVVRFLIGLGMVTATAVTP